MSWVVWGSESSGREKWRKEEAVVFGGGTQVEETATTRESTERERGESSHTQLVAVALTGLWEART